MSNRGCITVTSHADPRLAAEPRLAADPRLVAEPRLAALGGGHGLAASLRALRTITSQLTAIVSVADDGGSSGRLREAVDQAAPGDLRKCLLALADPSTPLARAFGYRFSDGDLEGHAFGNLMLSALAAVFEDLPDAVDAAGEMLHIAGRVLPATMTPVELVATTGSGDEVRGQVAVMRTVGVRRVRLEPGDARPPYSALDTIGEADAVLVGPGSLYTSVLAALAAPGLVEAINAADAPVLYVANLHSQPGEAEGYTLSDHVEALGRHGLVPDAVLYDPSTLPMGDPVGGAIAAPLANASGRAHDTVKLADAVRTWLADL